MAAVGENSIMPVSVTDNLKLVSMAFLLASSDLPIICRVPIDPNIVKLSDDGKPFVLAEPDSEATKSFTEIVEKIKKIIKGEHKDESSYFNGW